MEKNKAAHKLRRVPPVYYINLENDVQKYETLKDLFSSLSVSQAIIYCNSTRRVDDLQEAM